MKNTILAIAGVGTVSRVLLGLLGAPVSASGPTHSALVLRSPRSILGHAKQRQWPHHHAKHTPPFYGALTRPAPGKATRPDQSSPTQMCTAGLVTQFYKQLCTLRSGVSSQRANIHSVLHSRFDTMHKCHAFILILLHMVVYHFSSFGSLEDLCDVLVMSPSSDTPEQRLRSFRRSH